MRISTKTRKALFLIFLCLSLEAHAVRREIESATSFDRILASKNKHDKSQTSTCGLTCKHYGGKDACPAGRNYSQRFIHKSSKLQALIEDETGAVAGVTSKITELSYRAKGMTSCLGTEAGRTAAKLISAASDAIAKGIKSSRIQAVLDKGNCTLDFSKASFEKAWASLPITASTAQRMDALKQEVIGSGCQAEKARYYGKPILKDIDTLVAKIVNKYEAKLSSKTTGAVAEKANEAETEIETEMSGDLKETALFDTETSLLELQLREHAGFVCLGVCGFFAGLGIIYAILIGLGLVVFAVGHSIRAIQRYLQEPNDPFDLEDGKHNRTSVLALNATTSMEDQSKF
eukprot:TRINITY_DN17629_c1_g1_i1.p1 TRINITY_DN17629_c1_g1~~TRINITY_DN17629_c1_g1_i1.p1  ORF type:complete len:346 (+),score=59.83 TRINITY_DN17629_c1_g1_i1:64-1101(+)